MTAAGWVGDFLEGLPGAGRCRSPGFSLYIHFQGTVTAPQDNSWGRFPDSPSCLNLNYDTRTNGAGSLMRIYRDTRFSPDKTPYKTHQGMTFWEGPSKKAAPSGLFLRVEPEGTKMYTGVHRFDKEALAAYRDAVADGVLGAKLEEAISAVRAAGEYPIGGEHYKRVPRGYNPDHPRADLLRDNSLYTYSPRVAARHLGSPELIDLCFEHFANMAPLHHWLVEMHRVTD